jgi:mannitol-1-/sugar-/sorbitol-6-phosphatase
MTPVTSEAILDFVTQSRRGDRPRSIAVAGVAGSGKSTLGRALAATMQLPLLDLDAITNPLLDRLAGAALQGHWMASPYHRDVRDGRYAALRAVARDAVSTAGGAVLVAPFTAEVRGGAEWTSLIEAIAPAELCLIHLRGDAELVAARRAARGEARDAYRLPADGPVVPVVPHIAIDAELTPEQQLFRARRALGHRSVIDPANSLFAASFDAVLCDLDGALVDSTASVIRSWDRFAREFGVSAQALQDNHGQPARTLVERLLGLEHVAVGLARISDIEVADATGVEPVPGARAFFDSLPEPRRAIVTSGDPAIAAARLHAAGLPKPRTLVTIDDVRNGKPDPEPYLLGAQRLGVRPDRCLVVEDAPAGIAAARAAGCRVLAVGGTDSEDALTAADVVVDGLDRVVIRSHGDTLRLALAEPPS